MSNPVNIIVEESEIVASDSYETVRIPLFRPEGQEPTIIDILRQLLKNGASCDMIATLKRRESGCTMDGAYYVWGEIQDAFDTTPDTTEPKRRAKLTISIEAETLGDLEDALHAVTGKVRNGFTSGMDRNETGAYSFEIADADVLD